MTVLSNIYSIVYFSILLTSRYKNIRYVFCPLVEELLNINIYWDGITLTAENKFNEPVK